MRRGFLGVSLPHIHIPPISLCDCTVITPVFKDIVIMFKANVNPLHSLESIVSYFLQCIDPDVGSFSVRISLPSLLHYYHNIQTYSNTSLFIRQTKFAI